ncbi:hypothetical protein DRJ22_04545 [Candidatus Woesearchaeota archaeon]|nr:MAG: hypothetical protein B6U93_04515 [Candidatus Woesearchaeota archaeon ex4484_78]RLE45361.1 MAG: hypothetical protein DRJ22_04545 [Candidatus Woesearchaeota archaeon]
MTDFIWGAFAVIVIIAFSIAGAATVLQVLEGQKDCKTNTDCASDNYCGSDFECHPYPEIEKTIVKKDYTTAAAIIGISLIVGALILRKKREF